jgi:integrase/recombinase XerD
MPARLASFRLLAMASPQPNARRNLLISQYTSGLVREADNRYTDGSRKYLTQGERQAFLDAAAHFPRDMHTLCAVLTWTGCRVSEALALTADRVDVTDSTIRFECLKKRRRGVFRAVPVPPDLLQTLTMAYDLRRLQQRKDRGQAVRLWSWSRTTAWRHVHAVMRAAGLTGIHATAKGLRHSCGVAAVQASIPLNLVQRWLGHASLLTTAIYADAVGAEERQMASRMWQI